jgi:hypothetical protein
MKTSIVWPNYSLKFFAGIQTGPDEFKTGVIHDNSNPTEFELPASMQPLHEMINPIMKGPRLNEPTGIMPPGVLAVTNNFVIFERPPEFKNVFIIPSVVSDMREGGNYSDDSIFMYRLPLPWQLYIVHYNTASTSEGTAYYTTDVRMHFMDSNLSSFDQNVYSVPLPNFYSNGNLCRPMFASMDEIERYPKSITGVIQSAYDWIWNNGTNLDLTESVVQYIVQMYSQDIKNTVFGKSFEYFPVSVASGSYYTSMGNIDKFLKEWEKYSLEEVLHLFWPQNSHHSSHNTDFRAHVINHLPDFLHARNEEPYYDLHEDEDSSSQCELTDDPNNFCDCMFPQNYYNQDEFRAWLKENNKIPHLSAKKSILNFFEEFNPNVYRLSAYQSTSMYNNMLTKIMYST